MPVFDRISCFLVRTTPPNLDLFFGPPLKSAFPGVPREAEKHEKREKRTFLKKKPAQSTVKKGVIDCFRGKNTYKTIWEKTTKNTNSGGVRKKWIFLTFPKNWTVNIWGLIVPKRRLREAPLSN